MSRAGIDAHLLVGGSVAGIATADGDAVAGVAVFVFDGSGHDVRMTTTTDTGRYRVDGLTPGSDFRVCFDPTDLGTGLLPQCYRNRTWSGDDNPPAATATAIVVTAGAVATRINAALRRPTAERASG